MRTSTAGAAPIILALALAAVATSLEAQATDAGERPRLAVRPVFMFNQYLYHGSFGRPRSLAFDRRHSELWIADASRSRVGVFRPDGAELFSFRSERHLREPARVAVRPDGGLAILEGDQSAVRLFNYRGTYQGDLPLADLGAHPSVGAIAYDEQGNLYVGSNGGSEIIVYAPDGRRRLRFGSAGTGEGQFRSVAAIAIGSRGQIYVADHQALAIQVFDNQGNFLRGWGRHEMGAENVSLPSGLALDSAGRIYLSDELRHQVKIFDDSGRLLGVFGELGKEAGELSYPTDVAIGPDDRIYVAERLTARVQVFEIVPPQVQEH